VQARLDEEQELPDEEQEQHAAVVVSGAEQVQRVAVAVSGAEQVQRVAVAVSDAEWELRARVEALDAELAWHAVAERRGFPVAAWADFVSVAPPGLAAGWAGQHGSVGQVVQADCWPGWVQLGDCRLLHVGRWEAASRCGAPDLPDAV